jgi:hypothetical protein
MPSYTRNTDILDTFKIMKTVITYDPDEMLEMDLEMGDVVPRCNLKRKCDSKVFDEIVVQRGPQPSRFRGRNLGVKKTVGVHD